MAQWGRSSMGWFFGLKLHLVINNQGQIMAVRITAANVHDRHPLATLTAGLQGKIFGDKGYISKEMMQQLWQRGLHLITGIRRDMKNHLMPLLDKLLLRKRFIIETLLVKLKSHMGWSTPDTDRPAMLWSISSPVLPPTPSRNPKSTWGQWS